MEPFSEITELINKNNIKSCISILYVDTLKLYFYFNPNDHKTWYKTLEIQYQDDKYNVLILDNNVKRNMNLAQINEVIVSLDKECTHKRLSKPEIETAMKKYPKGTRIELIKMYDYLSPVPAGTKGTVEATDGNAHIYIRWDNGSGLSLIYGLDDFKIIEEGKNDKK